jgi:hypothetical protein
MREAIAGEAGGSDPEKRPAGATMIMVIEREHLDVAPVVRIQAE